MNIYAPKERGASIHSFIKHTSYAARITRLIYTYSYNAVNLTDMHGMHAHMSRAQLNMTIQLPTTEHGWNKRIFRLQRTGYPDSNTPS